MRFLRVGIVEEHEIFRRGIVSSLAEDPLLRVVFASASRGSGQHVDVVIASGRAAERDRFRCPLVVCGPERMRSKATSSANKIAAVLPRSALTAQQLTATVRAAASGLQVNVADRDGHDGDFDARLREVLRLLAAGADTREIATALSYSERTIKGLVQRVQQTLVARTRAQAVAEGIRQGLI